MGGPPGPARAAVVLREAFATEVAALLPGMQAAAADMLTTGRVTAARQLRGHVATFAATASGFGERVAARHARACEQLVARWCRDDVTRVPHEVAADAAGEVETLSLLLASWLVPGTA